MKKRSINIVIPSIIGLRKERTLEILVVPRLYEREKQLTFSEVSRSVNRFLVLMEIYLELSYFPQN